PVHYIDHGGISYCACAKADGLCWTCLSHREPVVLPIARVPGFVSIHSGVQKPYFEPHGVRGHRDRKRKWTRRAQDPDVPTRCVRFLNNAAVVVLKARM